MMKTLPYRISLVAGAFALALVAAPVDARRPHASAPSSDKDAAKSQPLARLVEYPELEQRVGSEIIVESTLGTVRRGKLVKYTNFGLTIELDSQPGLEYSVPRETVRNVSLVLEPAAGAAPDAPPAKTDAGSAKKN
jgi:hypothetical protein